MAKKMISAEEFYSDMIKNPALIKHRLLEKAQEMISNCLYKQKNYEDFNWNYDNHGTHHIMISRLCSSEKEIGDVEKYIGIFEHPLFPKEAFNNWLNSYGWKLEKYHSNDDYLIIISRLNDSPKAYNI